MASTPNNVRIGMNARLFPNNWRPVRDEILFAGLAGFRAIQLPGPATGLDEKRLDNSFDKVAELLQVADVMPVMEMIVRIDLAGRTVGGQTPLEVFQANLPAIDGIGVVCAHQHLVPLSVTPHDELAELEKRLIPQFAAMVELAAARGLQFGLEHNEPLVGLVSKPEACAMLLAAVPGLGLTWDLNHTPPDQLDGYLRLIPRMQMLHVADTPLPTVNYHLPLGLGNVDFPAYCRALLEGGFKGAAILEIGGLPQSGGYGRDTDDALMESLAYFEAALNGDPLPSAIDKP